MSRRRPRGSGGFTLIELLVSLAVGSLVILAAVGGSKLVVDFARREHAHARSVLRIEDALVSVREWIGGAYTGSGSEGALFVGRDREWRGMPSDQLVFATLNPGRLHGRVRGPLLVRLRVREEPAGGLVADYRELGGRGRWGSVLLLPGVSGLEARYERHSGRGNAVRDEWRSPARLPDVVVLRFRPPPGDSLSALLRLPFAFAPGAVR